MPLTFGDFSAWIEVDGTELPIFDVKKDGNEVLGWIPSESGKNFSVKWSTGRRTSSMAGDVHLDGKGLAGYFMRPGPGQTWTSSGVVTSATTERPFIFSKLELTDDDEYLGKAVAELGDVKLTISLATYQLVSSNNFGRIETIGKVHEKSKKATGHKIGLGEEKVVARMSMVSVTRHADIATFVFKYRPLDMLRAQGIAPPVENKKRAASPAEPEALDLTDDRPESDDDNERKIRALQDELASLQRKRRKNTHVKSEPGVKREPGTSAAGKNGRNVSLGFVDLT